MSSDFFFMIVFVMRGLSLSAAGLADVCCPVEFRADHFYPAFSKQTQINNTDHTFWLQLRGRTHQRPCREKKTNFSATVCHCDSQVVQQRLRMRTEQSDKTHTHLVWGSCRLAEHTDVLMKCRTAVSCHAEFAALQQLWGHQMRQWVPTEHLLQPFDSALREEESSSYYLKLHSTT